jgi:cyclopropane-fatty-acyl-phospholipid synthase
MGQTDTMLPASQTSRPAPVGGFDRWLLGLLHQGLGVEALRLVLGQAEVGAKAGSELATVRIKDRRTLLGILLRPQVYSGDAYADGRVEIEGDLVGMIEGVNRALREREVLPADGWRQRFLVRPNTERRSRQNVHHHYDLGNDFYRLWLDRELVYTCAYFPEPETDLETAQIAKMDHVCRKLRLRPEEEVVEAGCGWGALALHMARRYGVRVKAYNLSTEQVAFARERAKREGLQGRVEFVQDDYRTIRGRFDAFVSVGMLEHVGPKHYPTLGEVIQRTLKPGGRGLLHFIGRDRPRPLNAWIRRRIFPGAYPPTLCEVFGRAFEPWDISVLDVENLRLHYARTLMHWLARFEAAVDEVRARFDERFVRIWRLYLAGSQAAFTTGWLQLYQVVFTRGAENAIPWTRQHLYVAGLD